MDWDFPTDALDVVLMGRYGHLGWLRRPGARDREAALRCLEQVGMRDYAHRQISQLSGGQQQRVFLARALAQDARLYFMDEPFAGVDAATGVRSVWTMGLIFLLNMGVVGLCYKEFKICALDPQMAAAVGINVGLIHYLLMGLVSVTTVGAILVVAMMIVPAATAYLLTERLGVMLVLSVVQGAASSVLGYLLARYLDSSIAAAMTTVSGALFLLAFLLAPRSGLISRALAHRELRRRADAPAFAAKHLSYYR